MATLFSTSHINNNTTETKMRLNAKTVCSFASFLLLLFAAIFVADGRPLGPHNHLELVSDGSAEKEKESSFIVLKGIDYAEEGYCEQLYGFLPCSSNLAGHLFLIAVYEYLLFRGESLVASGGQRIFKILGPGVFGASAFHVLGSLPESLILLASGLLNSKEIAQEYVLTGVGLLAGSTILLLTIIWGTCVLVGSQKLSNESKDKSLASSSHQENRLKRLLSRSKGCGLVTDAETSYTARIMVISVIPFIIIQVPRVFGLSSSLELIFIIISLLLSVTFLLVYFFYQIFQPWIQKRRLEYVKNEHLVVDILIHVQNHLIGRMLTAKGAPNVPAIRRLFQETDRDGDNFISVCELKEFLKEIRFRKLDLDKEEATSEMLKDFDLDNDGKINVDEFVNGVAKWLDETKQALEKRYHSIRSMKYLYEVLQPWIEKKREDRETLKHLMSEIIAHVQSSTIGALLTEDGTPNRAAIRRLFGDIDHDKDNLISFPELKEHLADIKFGPTAPSVDEAVAMILEDFDTSRDEKINEEEFFCGLSKWLHKTDHSSIHTEENEDFFQRTWEQTDKLIEDKSTNSSPLAWTKAVFLLVLGIAMLGILAEPLIESVQNFSKAVNVPSFFISFILVPLATNARVAISAISEANRKKSRTTSLTFSEIYGGVFMNNMLGFSVLLSIIYFRGLSWTFSAELLIVLVVCAALGCFASLKSFIPLWSSFVVFLFYPLSLVLVFLLDGYF